MRASRLFRYNINFTFMRRFHRCSCHSILNSLLEELKGDWRKITSGHRTRPFRSPCLKSRIFILKGDVTFRRPSCFTRSEIIMAVNDRYCVFTIFVKEDELWKLGQRLITKHTFLICDQKNNVLSGVTLSVKEFKFKHSNKDSNSTQYLFSTLCGILNWAMTSLLVLLKRTLGFI